MMTTKTNRGRRGHGRRGFTLLEILLVVGLLALLAAIAIPALVGQGDKARIDMAKSTIGSSGGLARAIDLFRINTNQYPEQLNDLLDKPNDDAIAEKWAGPYLADKQMLIDPWGRPYVYQVPGDHNETKYDLYSLGVDGIDGNDDDITNWEKD